MDKEKEDEVKGKEVQVDEENEEERKACRMFKYRVIS